VQVLDKFARRSSSVVGSGTGAKRAIRSIKHEMLKGYLEALLGDLEVHAPPTILISLPGASGLGYRGTSLIRNSPYLAPCSRPMPRALR